MSKSGRSAKEAVVALVQDMPEDSSYDVRELVFNRMVERGLADVEAGRTISDEEMERSIESWRKG
jgi:predicted transcriptional regulator